MNDVRLIPKDELMHYGVKGMRWGHRKARLSAGINTAIAKNYSLNEMTYRKMGNNAMANANKKAAARAYGKAAASRAQADSIKRQIDGAKNAKYQKKQYGRLEDARSYKKKVKEKDLYKTYGRIEDSLRYSKRANKKAEAYAEKALQEIDRQLAQTGKKPTYDLKKVNDYIDKALKTIEDDLNNYRV